MLLRLTRCLSIILNEAKGCYKSIALTAIFNSNHCIMSTNDHFINIKTPAHAIDIFSYAESTTNGHRGGALGRI